VTRRIFEDRTIVEVAQGGEHFGDCDGGRQEGCRSPEIDLGIGHLPQVRRCERVARDGGHRVDDRLRKTCFAQPLRHRLPLLRQVRQTSGGKKLGDRRSTE
jgi:hypothetical protein